MYPEPEILLARPPEAAARRGRIAYIPYEDMGNAYTGRMRELLSAFGQVQRFAGIKSLLRQLPRSLRCYDAIVVNWMENAIVAFDTGRISLRATARLFFKTVLMKAFAKRMIFVRHNNYPHWTAAGSENLARRLVDLYEALFDVVVTHSGAEVHVNRTRRHYCPHPLYRQVDSLALGRIDMALPADFFVAFGRIVPYKKLDALIEAFPAHKTLIVAGSVGDAAYAERLARMQRENVIVLPGHLGEAQAQRLVRAARGVVIANAERDVVVSATFFYAMSLGCPVYAVTTPFLDWIRSRIGDELLVLGADLERLCGAIAGADARPVSAAARSAVRRELDDAAVTAALAGVLQP